MSYRELRKQTALLVAFFGVVALQPSLLSAQPYDLIIRNGLVYTGETAGLQPLEIGIRGDKNARIAPKAKGSAPCVIDWLL